MRLILVVLSLVFSVSLFASIESEVDASRFEHRNGTLIDHFSGLQWQDNKAAKTIEKKWKAAKNYCADLTLDGKNDWRLPSTGELSYTASHYKKFHNIKKKADYWTEDTYYHSGYPRSGTRAVTISFGYWGINWFTYGRHDNYYVDSKYKMNVRCVRGKKFIEYSQVKNTVEYTRKDKIEKVYDKLYDDAIKVGTIEALNGFLNTHPSENKKIEAQYQISRIKFKQVEMENTVQSYSNFIKNNSPYIYESDLKDAYSAIYTIAKNKNTLAQYEKLMYDGLVDDSTKKLVCTKIYAFAKRENSVQSYVNYIVKFYNCSDAVLALEGLYKLIKAQNNIAGYEWFIKTYPKAPQVKDAIANIHKLAFNKAKDINTISAYNTFIISYPMAKEVSQANELAKELERYKYTDTLPEWVRNIMPNFLADILNSIFGIFSSDEKKSRALLIKAKQIERQGNEYWGDKKAGYMIVANRMYDLLQEEYNDTDATLRFLESEEFKDFVRTFKRAMRDINDRLDNIARYSSEILAVSKEGFSQSHADSQMAAYHQEEKTKWDKYMHFRDKGYQ